MITIGPVSFSPWFPLLLTAYLYVMYRAYRGRKTENGGTSVPSDR